MQRCKTGELGYNFLTEYSYENVIKPVQQWTCLYRNFVVLLGVVTENVLTDRRKNRHTYKPSTATLTAHARRGLITEEKCQTLFVLYEHELS